MLAAVQATDEQLTAPHYMTQISAHPTFSYVILALLASQNTCCHALDELQSESDLH